MNEETEGKKLKEKLFNKKEIAWNDLSEEKMNIIMKFSDEYMYFLNNGKTERECASFVKKMFIENGFKDISETPLKTQ